MLPIWTSKAESREGRYTKSLKWKIVTAKVKAVKEKRLKLANKINVLHVEADLLPRKAEKLLKFEFLKQANQKRRIADNKQRKIKELEDIEANLLKKCWNTYWFSCLYLFNLKRLLSVFALLFWCQFCKQIK